MQLFFILIGVCEDDWVLEVIILVGIVCNDDVCVKMLVEVNIIQLLIELFNGEYNILIYCNKNQLFLVICFLNFGYFKFNLKEIIKFFGLFVFYILWRLFFINIDFDNLYQLKV